jgi:hypothetical protein
MIINVIFVHHLDNYLCLRDQECLINLVKRDISLCLLDGLFVRGSNITQYMILLINVLELFARLVWIIVWMMLSVIV